MVTTINYPAAPPAQRVKGTLLDAATVQDGLTWLDGHDLYESFNGMQFDAEASFCAPNTKTFDQGASWVDGFRFAAYGGVVCKALGRSPDSEQKIRDAFEMGESTAVERAMMKYRFVADTDPAARWAAPTDITPAGGAVSAARGIALLEGHAGSVYVGAPTLHVPRTIASAVLGVDGASFEGNVLRTKFGSKIAAGAGYDFPNTGPNGAAAPAGEKWIYATGEVFVGRMDVDLREVMDHATNEVFVLAERGYVVAVDSYAAAVRVTV